MVAGVSVIDPADWLALVGYVLKRTWPCIPRHRQAVNTYDDLYQDGVLGLYNAIRLFKPERGPFKTYAYVKIRWNILIAAGLTRQGWLPPEYGLREDAA